MHATKHTLGFCLWLALLLLQATVAWSQDIDPNRVRVNIEATFENAYGEPMEGATIKLTDLDQALEYSATSDSNGFLSFEGVRPGQYRVSILQGERFHRVTDEANQNLVTVTLDGRLEPDILTALQERVRQPGMWKQILLFFGIAAAGGVAVI